MIWLPADGTSQECTDQITRQNNKHSDRKDRQHWSEVQGLGSLVIDGDEVDQKGSCADTDGNQQGTNHHLSDPELSAGARIKTATKIAIYRRSNSVHEDCSVQKRSTFGVEFANDCEADNDEKDSGDMVSRADKSW